MQTTDTDSLRTVLIDHSLVNKQAMYTGMQTGKQAETGMFESIHKDVN